MWTSRRRLVILDLTDQVYALAATVDDCAEVWTTKAICRTPSRLAGAGQSGSRRRGPT